MDASTDVTKVVALGVSHWHLPNYLPPLLARPDVRIVGVADPDPSVAQRWGAELDCAWSADYRDLVDRTRPGLAVVLGRHCDMAETGRFLADAGVAFIMEKPCGLDSKEVGALAEDVERAGVFAAVPLVWRRTDFTRVLRENTGGDRFESMSLRIVSGHPDRYLRAGCPWMLDPALSGGGSTINLAIHLIDLFAVLTGEPVELMAAQMSNTSFGESIEDWSALLLRAGDAVCTAESGLLYPAETGTYEVAFSIKTDRHYVQADFSRTVIRDHYGCTEFETPAANKPTYAAFVHDCVDRFRRGDPPPSGVADVRSAMAVVDDAYRRAAPFDVSRLETP